MPGCHKCHVPGQGPEGDSPCHYTCPDTSHQEGWHQYLQTAAGGGAQVACTPAIRGLGCSSITLTMISGQSDGSELLTNEPHVCVMLLIRLNGCYRLPVQTC